MRFIINLAYSANTIDDLKAVAVLATLLTKHSWVPSWSVDFTQNFFNAKERLFKISTFPSQQRILNLALGNNILEKRLTGSDITAHMFTPTIINTGENLIANPYHSPGNTWVSLLMGDILMLTPKPTVNKSMSVKTYSSGAVESSFGVMKRLPALTTRQHNSLSISQAAQIFARQLRNQAEVYILPVPLEISFALFNTTPIEKEEEENYTNADLDIEEEWRKPSVKEEKIEDDDDENIQSKKRNTSEVARKPRTSKRFWEIQKPKYKTKKNYKRRIQVRGQQIQKKLKTINENVDDDEYE